MKKRLLWSAFAMTVLVLLGFFAPLIYWRITGLVRGEAFYAGKPSCYWREAAKEEFNCTFDLPDDDSVVSGRSAWCETFLQLIPSDREAWRRMQEDEEAVPVLRDLLHDKDKRIRAVAAMTICSLGEHASEMIPELIHYLIFDAEDVVARGIAGRIGNLDCTRAVPLLCRWLGSEDKTAKRAMAAVQNFRHGAEEAIPIFVENMGKENNHDAGFSLYCLGPKSIPALKELLKSANVHARRNATWTLANYYDEDYEGHFPDRVFLLVQQSTDADVTVRLHANRALSEVPGKKAEALASLMLTLQDPDAKVRGDAICTIKNSYLRSDGPEVRVILAEFRALAVFDENAEVRAAAKNAVECARGPYAAP